MKWIEQLDFEVKIYNRLKKAGISTTDDLVEALYSRETKISAPDAKKCEAALKDAGIIKYMRGDYVTEEDIEPNPLTWDELHDYIGKLVVFDCSTESHRWLKVNWIYDIQDDGEGTAICSDGGKSYSYIRRSTVNGGFKRDPEYLKRHEHLKNEGRMFALKSKEVKTVSETQVMSADYTKAVSLTRKIKANAAAAQESLWEVCKGLKEMHDGKLYKELDYQNFEEYSENEVGIKRKQAHKYISIAGVENVQSTTHFEQLGTEKLYLLSRLDEPQREEIQQNVDVESVTVKELKDQITALQKDNKSLAEDRQREGLRADRLAREAREKDNQIESLVADNDEAKDTIKSLEQQIEALEDRPVEVAVQANDAEIDKLTAQFQEELAKRDKDTERRLNEQSQRHKEELRKQREQLEKAAEEADVEVEDEIREKAELEMHIKFVTDAMRKLAHWLFANDPVGENGYRHYAAKKIEEVSKIITKEEE